MEWDKATPAEARDLVLWLRQAAKPRPAARTVSVATAGTVNPVTRKRHLGDRYEPRTVRHSNAVVRSFYNVRIGQLPVEELVDRQRIQCRPVRDVLVRYLNERATAVDHSTL